MPRKEGVRVGNLIVLVQPDRAALDQYRQRLIAIYQRIFELITGRSLLDVDCSFGFFPVLMAEHDHTLHIIGSDVSQDAISFSTTLANAAEVRNVAFSQIDVLSEDFPKLGRFDTMTAIHLLEHLAEEDMPAALDHLRCVKGV